MEIVSLRRALASLIFAFHGLVWLANTLLGPPEIRAAATAMTLVYLVGYFAVSADWFWGRWYGLGLCYYGSLYLLGMFQFPELAPVILLMGGSHVFALFCLYGSTMASSYEGSPEWRLAFNVDEDTARRLGRSVQSAATTIPILILQLLGPRPESSLLVLAVLGLAAAGLFGLLRLRTWSLLALGGAGVGLLSTLGLPPEALGASSPDLGRVGLLLGTAGLLAPLFLWARPLRRSLRS